ncbi:microtubule associated protein [Glomus cerebriforme]|uniref:Microtubule associated protein n=1 Tax=Glomus cerebriforme TaxID=658196 RepID=A0A397TCB1_9GLOM|nr:microtubule associated protein [Glomus cerebriforme]
MDALYFKVDQLKSLWQEYRVANEASGRDYSDHGEWAREKLQGVLTEFDKLIQEQILWKSTLAAEIEDMFSEIEEYCHIFGRRVDTIIDQAALLSYEVNNTTRDKLVIIRDALKEEYEVTRLNVNKWLVGLNTFVLELDVDYIVPSVENFETDLSTAVVRPLWCRYDEYSRVVVGLRGSFENSAIKLHYYWEKLNYKPQDEIDKALSQIFLDKSNPKELYETLLQNEQNNQNKDNENSNDNESEQKSELDLELQGFVYYTPQLPEGLKLKSEHLEILKNKLIDLGKVYEERRGKLTMIQQSIKNLYDELNIPEADRIELIDSLDQEYLDKLEAEFERLREIMRAIIQKAIEEYTVQLGELWDKCLVPQYERDEFFFNLRALVSAEEVYELLAQEVDRLQDLYVKCAKIYRLMLERRALIEKMILFEKTASDPRRLFQPSFRLLEEEKWRKSCWPNLVKIEDQLINACLAYEEAERKPFMHESKRYLDTLQSEISERIVNQMFFGFEQGAGKKEDKEKENPRNSAKRRDSQATPRISASRPVSPTFSVNGDASKRKSMAPSRPVSPTSNGTRSRRNSQVPRMSISRATSPSGFGSQPRSRRNSQAFPPSRSVSPARSVASSRAVSPARSEITATRRRSSMYLSSPVESTSPTIPTPRTKSTDNKSTNSRRTSLYVSNSTTNKTNGTKSSNKSNNKSVEDKSGKSSRRQSLYLGDNNNDNITRSDSVSSSSSESSSVSSVSTPTTPEPSQISYVVNGRLGVPTKIKMQPSVEVQSKSNIKSTTKSTTKSSIPSSPRPTVTRRSNTAPAKPRPRSTIVMSDEPAAMLKKQATKRMSMIIDGGH